MVRNEADNARFMRQSVFITVLISQAAESQAPDQSLNRPKAPMFDHEPSYTLPRWAWVRWLTDTGRDLPADVRGRLIATFFTSTMSLLLGAFANLVVNIVALIRHPTAPFFALIGVDGLLLIARIVLLTMSVRAAERGHRTPTDMVLLSSVAWACLVGIGTALCFATCDPVLQSLAPTAMMGLIGGIATRNNGAPRLAFVQVILCDIPFQLMIPYVGQPLMLVSAILCPLFILGLFSTIQRLNQGYVAVIMAEKDSERRATHDSLTGLLNRDGLMAALTRALRHAVQQKDEFALLYLDLDEFKSVNDGFGHAAGDELLRQVAKRLNGNVPETCLKGRLGGDEFVILAPGLKATEAKGLGDAVIAAICQVYDIVPGAAIKVGVSIGIACAMADTDAEALLGAADAALYEAKIAGKGRCCVAATQDVILKSSRRLAA